MRNFILGTDWWTDCDDAVALRILARAHKAGEISLKAIGINACMEYSVPSLEGFLNTENVPDIPLGIDFDATDFGGNPPYQKRLAAYASKFASNSGIGDAVSFYRKTLAESHERLEIIEIGYLQVIAGVLQSQGDEISEKTGLELVKEKVSKIWVMAGKWNVPNGKENNFARNERARKAGKIFCDLCPVPVTFLGWEVGATVISGGNLTDGDVLHQVLCDHGSAKGRSSWDPMLVHLALIGDEDAAGYNTVCGTASLNEETGENNFEVNESGMHKYVIKKFSDEYYRDRINEIIK